MRRLSIPLLLLAAACSPEQQRTSFPVSVAAVLPSGPNDHGWSVQLDEARACVGPVRFFEGKVLLSSRLERLLWLPFGGIAHAHPGHYVAGESMAEILTPQEVDLLAPGSLGEAEGVTGDYGSLQLTLCTFDDGASILLRGTATRDGDEIPFIAQAALPSPIEGIRAELSVEPEPRPVRLAISVAEWLRRVDFSTATDTDSDGTFELSPSSQAHNALTRGLGNTTAYDVSWAE